MTGRCACARGQATLLLVGGLAGVLVLAFVLGGVARGLGARAGAQRAADLAALAGARAMHDAFPRLFAGPHDPHRLERGRYLALGRAAAERVARRNGAGEVRVGFPDGATFAPVRIRVEVRERLVVRRGQARRRLGVAAVAEAELSAGVDGGIPSFAAGGGYSGPLAHRQGKPMRPDVARAFDRMFAAARADGVALVISSGYRSDAEQAVLFAARPDPRWVAPPGKSLHRYGTELDIGPPTAYPWLRANARRFHFIQRYAWEPWHWGYALNARSAPPAAGAGHPHGRGDGVRASAIPSFVPPRFAPMIGRAAQRWNVSAALLAAQIHAESNFNPFAVSPAGARGIAQFMPGTARAYGLSDPHDPAAAIHAQARMMRDLLREFASVPLALAAYNAGPGRVRACHCIPPFPETRGYVARILGLMGGAGEGSAGQSLEVRLVR